MALIVHDDGENVNFYRNKEKTKKRKEKRLQKTALWAIISAYIGAPSGAEREQTV